VTGNSADGDHASVPVISRRTRRARGHARRTLAPPAGGRFAAVIFDMGSTLLEFENVPWPVLYPTCVDSALACLVRMHKPAPPSAAFFDRFMLLLERRRERIREELREYRIGALIRDLLRPFAIKLRTQEMARLLAAYYAPIRRQVSVYPDAEPTLASLKQAGYRVGLLSNTCFRVRDHREELAHFGLWPHLDAAAFTSTGIFRKPHPEPFRRIARGLGVPLRRCVFVGDRQIEDVQGSQQVGMTAVLIRRPGRSYQAGLTDSLEIDSLGDLRSWLE